MSPGSVDVDTRGGPRGTVRGRSVRDGPRQSESASGFSEGVALVSVEGFREAPRELSARAVRDAPVRQTGWNSSMLP